MKQRIKAKQVSEIVVIDPDSNAPVHVAIFKLETGGMMGIDSSFLQTDEDFYSPFDKGVAIDDDYE